MSVVAWFARILFVVIGSLLMIFGTVLLAQSLTGEGVDSWSDAIQSVTALTAACLFLMTSFVAHLVILAEDRFDKKVVVS